MRDADEDAFSMVSTAPDIATLYTPPETERDTDEAGLFTPADSDTEDDDRWETTSNCSTSVAPSVYEYERAFGRQYHSYKKGRYPMPNDELERQREETKHTMMLELMVSFCRWHGMRPVGAVCSLCTTNSTQQTICLSVLTQGTTGPTTLLL